MNDTHDAANLTGNPGTTRSETVAAPVAEVLQRDKPALGLERRLAAARWVGGVHDVLALLSGRKT